MRCYWRTRWSAKQTQPGRRAVSAPSPEGLSAASRAPSSRDQKIRTRIRPPDHFVIGHPAAARALCPPTREKTLVYPIFCAASQVNALR